MIAFLNVFRILVASVPRRTWIYSVDSSPENFKVAHSRAKGAAVLRDAGFHLLRRGHGWSTWARLTPVEIDTLRMLQHARRETRHAPPGLHRAAVRELRAFEQHLICRHE